MITNKTVLVLAFSLLVSLVLVGCGTQVEPTEASAPQSTDPEPAPATEAPAKDIEPAPTEASEEAAPTVVPAESPADASTTDVSFSDDVQPIIESRCVNCHGGDRIEAELLMRTYDEIMAGSENGAVVIPSDVEGSLLVELVANKKMPKRGPKLTPPQAQLISDWVAAGAPNN